MPLPNTNPAINPALQEGLHPDDIARMEIRQKKTNEMIANLNDRLADISSFGQSFQQGIYSSFGNNFITRSAIGIPQMIGDVIDSLLLSDEAKKKKDPIGSALQDILDELHTIDDHLIKSFGSTIKDAFDEAINKMDKKQENSSDCCEKSLEVLNKILDTINKAFREEPKKEDPIVNLKDNNQIVSYKEFKASELPKKERVDSFIEPTEVFEVNPNRLGYSSPEKKDTLASRVTKDSFSDVKVNNEKILDTVFEVNPNRIKDTINPEKKDTLASRVTKDSFSDVKVKPVANKAVDIMLGVNGDKPINVNIVGAAIDRLNEMDKEMEKMVSIIPLSTAEQELESNQKNIKPIKEEIKDVSTKKEIKEEKKEEKKEESSKSEEPKKESSILGSAMDTLGGIAESYGLAKGAKAVLSKGGSLLGKIPKGVGLGAIASIGTDLAADYYGRDTKTGAGLDVVSDAASMASTGAMIGSFVPGIGTAAGAVVGGIAGAGYGLYKNWNTLFDDKSNEINFSSDPTTNKATMFERKTEELDATKSINKTGDNSTQNTSVVNNVRNNNIYPSRQGSKNEDTSYNRYLDTTFYFQGR